MLMNDKIIFDRYYCINSAKKNKKKKKKKKKKNERNKVQKRRKYDALYFTASLHFHTRRSFRFYARSGRTSVSHY